MASKKKESKGNAVAAASVPASGTATAVDPILAVPDAKKELELQKNNKDHTHSMALEVHVLQQVQLIGAKKSNFIRFLINQYRL